MKNATKAIAPPPFPLQHAAISACDCGSSSASDMNSMTPALRPKAPARKSLLIFFLNSTSAPPMPVESPAATVSSSAVMTPFIIVILYLP